MFWSLLLGHFPACLHIAMSESAKSLLCHIPVLPAPDLNRPFKLEVDASAVRAGAVLLQEDLQVWSTPFAICPAILRKIT